MKLPTHAPAGRGKPPFRNPAVPRPLDDAEQAVTDSYAAAVAATRDTFGMSDFPASQWRFTSVEQMENFHACVIDIARRLIEQ